MTAVLPHVAPPVDYPRLVENDRVHGSVYTDPRIFAEEMDRIYHRGWVFVGHTSEIAQPGDYRQTWVGTQAAILTRDKAGEVHVLMNRCSHRGAQVCDQPRGNSKNFRCPYHGWTFSNSGEVLGFPYQTGYGDGMDKADYGLARAQVGIYRGFVFARLTTEGPTLAEHLGAAAEGIDRFVEFSPVGEMQFSAGWGKHDIRANWKILLENETDGYHPGFVHRSIFSVVPGSGLADVFSDKSASIIRDLGGGHTELDLRPEYRQVGRPLTWLGSTREKLAGYVADLEAARGVERAAELLEAGPPHVMVFPNLFLAELSVAWFQPVSVERTIQHGTVAQFAGADQFNRRIIRKAEGTIGPAGLLQADDAEMYERVHRGVETGQPEWVVLRRGLQREHEEPGGAVVSNSTDETTLRAIWRHYRDVMTADTGTEASA